MALRNRGTRHQAIRAFADRWMCEEVDARGSIPMDAPGVGAFRDLIDDIITLADCAPNTNKAWHYTIGMTAAKARMAFKEWRDYNDFSESVTSATPPSAFTRETSHTYYNALKRSILDAVLDLSQVA